MTDQQNSTKMFRYFVYDNEIMKRIGSNNQDTFYFSVQECNVKKIFAVSEIHICRFFSTLHAHNRISSIFDLKEYTKLQKHSAITPQISISNFFHFIP